MYNHAWLTSVFCVHTVIHKRIQSNSGSSQDRYVGVRSTTPVHNTLIRHEVWMTDNWCIAPSPSYRHQWTMILDLNSLITMPNIIIVPDFQKKYGKFYGSTHSRTVSTCHYVEQHLIVHSYFFIAHIHEYYIKLYGLYHPKWMPSLLIIDKYMSFVWNWVVQMNDYILFLHAHIAIFFILFKFHIVSFKHAMYICFVNNDELYIYICLSWNRYHVLFSI